jgi:metal-responsive CopG/Arc/MetJ family transcriptional regulator
MSADENTTAVMVRLPQDLLRQVDDWRRGVADLPSRPEAIRRLSAAALENSEKAEGGR